MIGAGPSGIAAAKAARECNLDPVVFEAAAASGGLWRHDGGYVWRDMRTNLSKWTCSFSDYPWPHEADDFPPGHAVEEYVANYASEFGVAGTIAHGERVTEICSHRNGWALTTSRGRSRQQFDGVVVASGIFARKFVPPLPGIADFKGTLIHSGDYRNAEMFKNGRVVVVGGSLSGIEIASHLADHGIEVILLFGRPAWILPRYAPVGGQDHKAPLDLVLYNRRSQTAESLNPPSMEEKNRKTAAFFEIDVRQSGRRKCCASHGCRRSASIRGYFRQLSRPCQARDDSAGAGTRKAHRGRAH